VASDHLPVLVDFKLRAQVRAAATTEGMSIAQAASS
jgi:hypothetical protein